MFVFFSTVKHTKQIQRRKQKYGDIYRQWKSAVISKN